MKENSGGGKINWPVSVGLSLVLVAGVLLFWFFMKGETTITGNWPEPELSQSMSCESNNFAYPFFTYDKSTKKSTRINIIFNNDNLYSIALIYNLYLNDAEIISSSEAANHAAMNISFGNNGLEAESLGMDFARLQDSLKMSLYAKSSDINSASAKYFLLDDNDSKAYNVELVKKSYENKGFVCTDVVNNG